MVGVWSHTEAWLIDFSFYPKIQRMTIEDDMSIHVNGHEFGWTPGVDDGQGGLACCGSWGRKESDMTEWLN